MLLLPFAMRQDISWTVATQAVIPFFTQTILDHEDAVALTDAFAIASLAMKK